MHDRVVMNHRDGPRRGWTDVSYGEAEATKHAMKGLKKISIVRVTSVESLQVPDWYEGQPQRMTPVAMFERYRRERLEEARPDLEISFEYQVE